MTESAGGALEKRSVAAAGPKSSSLSALLRRWAPWLAAALLRVVLV